jgi:hypothetical protein
MAEDPEDMENTPAIYRRVLLRIVFWALGLAACFGAVGVIFAGHETLWRIVGTCAATGAGALLLLGACRQLDQEATWLPGVLAVCLIVSEYLGTLGLTWNLFRGAEERMAQTMIFLVGAALPAIAFAAIRKRPAAAVSARVGFLASGVVFVLLMVGTWGSGLGEALSKRWQLLGLSLAAFAALAVLCLIGTGTDRRHWRWAGVAAAAGAFSISAYAILMDIHQTSAFFVCIVSVAAVVAHANAMAWCPLKPTQRWVLWGTIGAGVATAGFVDLARIAYPWHEEMLERLGGAMAIIGGCGTLALLVVARINQRFAPTAVAATELRELRLTCPRCRATQTISLGLASCEKCGLLIEVRVEEPKPEAHSIGAL